MLIETQVALAVPIETAWRALIDLPAYERWNPYLTRIEGEAVGGAAIRVHASVPGRAEPLIQDVQVLEVAPYAMRWEGGLPDRAQFRGDHWFVLARVGEHCTLDHFEEFDGALAPAILAQHGETIRANFERFNAALKTYLESRP
jgi:hypothetical protein